jgi:HEAT repeat protein
VVVAAGALLELIRLLGSSSNDVREQCVRALGNISGDGPHTLVSHPGPQYRDQVLGNDGAVVVALGKLATEDGMKLSIVQIAAWAISNLCRGKPKPSFALVQPALPALAKLLLSQDEKTLTDSCWALSYLANGPNDNIQAVIDAGVCRRLVELLTHPSPSVQTPVLHAVGNIVTGEEAQTQTVIDSGGLPALCSLLSHSKDSIQKHACFAISNITAGSRIQIQAVFDASILPPLLQLLSGGADPIRTEAAWAVSNATSGGSAQQIKYLVAQECIRPLCDFLTIANTDIITVALEGLENILKAGETEAKKSDGTGVNQMVTLIDEAEGLHKIKQLQHRENHDICEKAVKVLVTYFDVEDDKEPAVAPEEPTTAAPVANANLV